MGPDLEGTACLTVLWSVARVSLKQQPFPINLAVPSPNAGAH